MDEPSPPHKNKGELNYDLKCIKSLIHEWNYILSIYIFLVLGFILLGL